MQIPKSVATVISEFEKLPGIGPKSAQRLTYYLLHAPKEYVAEFAEAVGQLRENTVLCSTCYNVAEADPCEVCGSKTRDRTAIMVVEEPLDALAMERSHSYKGLYHVLHGVIAPLDNIGPDELYLRQLLPRLKSGEVTEVILATNPNIEGEATAMYIQKLISPLGIKTTRIARGLPTGADLEYADETTLSRAVEGRVDF
ncbi:MAG TPA: recombination mediator RecR [Candidatus Saccharimonadales bacterium]|nr:recombination mediator RecR [Candidatus Saccharimonadales bacterium]